MTEEDLSVDAACQRLDELVRASAAGDRFRIETEQGDVAYLIGL